ncbi:DUF6192 family protein [Streptomyces sp. NBC_01643]|uniref:DUF6192 family protein n=1 Tax=Streptomyces sp. NBC_01643 TaxID=2975906 RepID=UPI002F91590E|nr:DUF6192 family protein [Streptomyces sp. NBC_01643]
MVREKLISPFLQRYTDRRWGRYVRQGRDLALEESRIQFKLGDITLKTVHKSEPGEKRGAFTILDRYADHIGINVHTLLGYRFTAMQWPPEHREPGVSWSVHRALESLDDRFELIQEPPNGADHWTEDTALRRAGRLPHRPLTKEEELDRVRTLLTNSENALGAVDEIIRRPDVAHRVMANPANQRIRYRTHHEQRMEAAADRLAAAHERDSKPADSGPWEQKETTTAHPQPPARLREPAVDYQRASREALG